MKSASKSGVENASERFSPRPGPVLRGHVPTVHLCKKDCLEILTEFRTHRVPACVSERSQRNHPV